MKKLNIFKIVIMSFLMFMTISTYAANIQWDGHIDTNGDGVSWNDPFNWVGDVIPGTADNAIFPTGVGTLTVTGTATSAVASLQIWNTTNISLDLDVTVTSTNATVVKIFDGSTLSIKSGATLTVTVTGTNAGAVLFDKPNGTFNVEAGGTIDLNAWRGITSSATSTSAAVNNYGVMNITATNASIQPNNATAMTIINHPCGIINQLTPTNSGRMKIWSNAAVSTVTNNGLITFAGTTTPISVSGSNISTNNGFYKIASGSVLFASGSGTKIENGIDLNSSDTLIDATNTCSVTGMGILTAYDWYSDAAGTTMVGSNDAAGLLSFSSNAFATAGTKTIYTSCYGNDVAITVQNVDGNCVTTGVPTTVDLTFTVDMSQYGNSFTTVYISGDFNNWNGTSNALTDQGNGIWTGTITVPENDSIEYKFTLDNWNADEIFTGGETCTKTTGGFTNRFLTYGNTNTTVPTVCWQSCSVCPSTVDLTFTVDMSQYNGTFTTAYIFGSFNGWNGTANPLTDQGNGIWTGTITQPENDSIEYKFLADGTQESFVGGETCTKTSFGFTNRFLTFGNMNMAVDTVCWNNCMTCPTIPPPTPDSVDVTFLVNTANITVDPAGLYLAGGGNFGNPGDNPLTDANGDGVYEITVRKEKGFSSFYIFTNGNCPNYSCKENLGGLPCADPNNFNDRFLNGVYSDTTLLTCYATCAIDTVCPAPPSTVDLTFTVDMSQYSGTFTTAYIFGSFNGWNGTANPLTDQGNGIWTGTITQPENDSIEYKFLADGTQESFVGGETCTKTSFGFTNRFLTFGNMNMAVDTVCWNSCMTCPAIPPPAPDSVDVTFLVNTANITVDATGLYLAGGGTFGIPGDNPMSDSNGDGVWEITVKLPEGFTTDYTFTNGNCPNWNCKEDISGQSCAVAPHNDRNFAGAWNDTIVLTCFGSCATDTICPAPPSTVDLTFTVDMSQYSGTFTTAYIFGSFNSWNATANPLTDQGNGLWSGTITVPENDSIEYKFLADGTAEAFVGGETCTKTTGAFTNRLLTYGNMNTTVSTVCWESCSACYTPNIQWDGHIDANGDGVSWNDPFNWVGDVVPGATEQAIFPSSVDTVITGTATSPVAGIQVWNGADVTLDLDVTVNSTTANTVRLFDGSTLTVKTGRTLDVTLTGVNDGCIIFTQPNGTFNVEAGATANLNGWRGINSYATATTATVNNYGTMNITASNASIQPNNATAMTIVNHACGTINILSGVMKIWSNAAVSTVTNFGFINNMIGSGGALSVSGNNIAINNAFFASATGSFAAGSGTKIDNGVNANNTIVIDAMNSCSVTNMGILTDYNWYSDSTSMNMVGNNDTLGALTFNTNAFATAGTQTIYTCYDADVVFEVQNLSGPCVNSSTAIDTVDLTFTVDMSQYGSFTTAFIFGNFNSWNATANPLTDQGNGIWSGTISVPENDSIEYKFLADGTAETFAVGEACTKTSFGFTNRFLTFGTMDMTLDTVCWNSCSACLPAPDSVMVTFKVDMSLADSIASDGVFLAGAFNGWTNTPMMSMNNDSIYEVTLTVAESSTYEFKFKNGANGWESMDTSFSATCVLPSSNNNRVITVGTVDETLTAYCFNTCVTCDIVLPTSSVFSTATFSIMPNPANEYLQLSFGDEYFSNEKTIFLHNAMGQLMFNTTINLTNNYRVNTTDFPSGMYFITVQTAEGKLTKRIMINH